MPIIVSMQCQSLLQSFKADSKVCHSSKAEHCSMLIIARRLIIASRPITRPTTNLNSKVDHCSQVDQLSEVWWYLQGHSFIWIYSISLYSLIGSCSKGHSLKAAPQLALVCHCTTHAKIWLYSSWDCCPWNTVAIAENAPPYGSTVWSLIIPNFSCTSNY